MRKKDLCYLIPDEYYSASIPTKSEHEFLYIGQESILHLSAVWYKKASDLLAEGIASEDIVERMFKVSESQEYRQYGDYLRELATRATSKPSIFQKDVFRPGDRVTCFIYNPSTTLRGDLKRSNRFLDAIVIGVNQGDGKTIYSVALRNQKEQSNKRYRFIPDHISAIATDDFHYFKNHPNFFRLCLNVRAKSESEREKIEPILSAL